MYGHRHVAVHALGDLLDAPLPRRHEPHRLLLGAPRPGTHPHAVVLLSVLSRRHAAKDVEHSADFDAVYFSDDVGSCVEIQDVGRSMGSEISRADTEDSTHHR